MRVRGSDAGALVDVVAGDHERPTAEQWAQGLHLGVVEGGGYAVGVIDRPAGDLEELAGEHGGVGDHHVALLQLEKGLLLGVVVDLAGLGRHGDLDVVLGHLRQVEVVGGAHGQRHVLDALLDGLLRARLGLPVVLHVVGGLEVGTLESLEGLAEALAVVQEADLGEQLHVAVGRRGAGQTPTGRHGAETATERIDAFAVVVLRSGQLVEHHAVERRAEVPRQMGLDQLGQRLVVDEVDLRLPLRQILPPLGAAQ